MTGQLQRCQSPRLASAAEVYVDSENIYCAIPHGDRNRALEAMLSEYVYKNYVVIGRPKVIIPRNWKKGPSSSTLDFIRVECDHPNAIDEEICRRIYESARSRQNGFNPSLVIFSGDGIYLGPIAETRDRWQKVVIVSAKEQLNKCYHTFAGGITIIHPGQ